METLYKENQSLKTDIGIFEFTAVVTAPDGSPEPKIDLSVFPAPFSLPEGESVKRVSAVLLQVASGQPVTKCTFQCLFRGSALGSPCTGQWLDAQEWESEEDLVVVGTEDSEALLARIPSLNIEEYSVTSTLLPDRIEMELYELPSTFTLHYLVAEDLRPDEDNVAAWSAVGFPHKGILSAVAS